MNSAGNGPMVSISQGKKSVLDVFFFQFNKCFFEPYCTPEGAG
jgi:hypothetical protein